MNLGLISLILLLAAIVIGFVRNCNVGIICFGFSMILGIAYNLSIKEIMAGFSSSLFIQMVGITYLFAIINGNGTLELLANKLVRLVGKKKHLVPFVMYVLGFAICAVGPGAIPSLAIEPITDADTSDFLPTLEESGTVDGNLLGYPMWVNAKILIYRKDLLPEDKVPKTWDEYKALAKEMKTDDMYGTTVFGSGSDAVCSFLDFACQAGADGLVYDKDGNVNITDQPYVDALDFMVEMANEDCTPSDSLATASTESQELFNNGKVAMQLNWSHQYPAAVEALGADKVGCAPMIAGSAGVGATTGPWYECVMKNSENKDMALKYVEYMYDHNADYMNGTLKIAGRTSVYEEAGKEAGNEHTTAVLDTLNEKQSQPRPMISTWSQVEEVLTGVVESCLGGADVKETLESAKEEIEAIGK